MTREEKTKRIYKEIANKEPTPGCLLSNGIIVDIFKIPYYYCYKTSSFDRLYFELGAIHKNHKIIGHPVMIGDVIAYIKKNYKEMIGELVVQLLGVKSQHGIRVDLTEDIENQTDECIDFVYSIIQ